MFTFLLIKHEIRRKQNIETSKLIKAKLLFYVGIHKFFSE